MSSKISKRRGIIMIMAAVAIAAVLAGYTIAPKGIYYFSILDADGNTIGDELLVYAGTDTKTEYEIEPEAFADRKVSYQVADEGVITVDEAGTIHAAGTGETLLTAEIPGVKQDIKVTVRSAVKDITGIEEDLTLTEGDTHTLEPAIEMAAKGLKEPELKYSSNDEKVATVDKDGVITAVEPGTTTITVKAASVEKKINVTVERKVVVVSRPVYTPPARSSGNSGGTSSRSNSGNTGSDNGSWEE